MEKAITILSEMITEEKVIAVDSVTKGNLYSKEIAVDTMVTLKEVSERLGILDDVKHLL